MTVSEDVPDSHDFDFLFSTWSILDRLITSRLTGSRLGTIRGTTDVSANAYAWRDRQRRRVPGELARSRGIYREIVPVLRACDADLKQLLGGQRHRGIAATGNRWFPGRCRDGLRGMTMRERPSSSDSRGRASTHVWRNGNGRYRSTMTKPGKPTGRWGARAPASRTRAVFTRSASHIPAAGRYWMRAGRVRTR